MMKKTKTQRGIYAVPETKALLLLHNEVFCASNYVSPYEVDDDDDVEF